MATNLSEWITSLGGTIKGAAKIALQSRRCPPVKTAADRRGPLVVMGNGPSLGDVIMNHFDELRRCDTMSVNFAANDPSFTAIQPRYHVFADPHFFEGRYTDPNVGRLMDSLGRVDWPMTLIIPAQGVAADFAIDNPHIEIMRINCVGIEGFDCFTHFAFSHRLGMPRPRNVLIPALMSGIWMGYGNLYIVGADHSWMRTLSVDSHNRVVSVQPHFYKDNQAEYERVAAVYDNVRLHEIIHSFYVAFKAYHDIERYARSRGIRIVNATPGSFIDAFERFERPDRTPPA